MELPLDVQDDERLARYILYRRHIRRDDSVRPEAFMPHPHVDLSVTRHLGLNESQIWKIGQRVADQRGKPLFGRADVVSMGFTQHRLKVVGDPIPDNPNHANVSNWPSEKSQQKILALEIAKAAGRAKFPEDGGREAP